MLRRLAIVGLCAAALVLALGATANAGTYVWDLSTEADYYVSGSATWVLGEGVVAAEEEDEASVLAKINTQAPGLKLGSIIGGGYEIADFSTDSPGTPGVVYGSLYLSPTGGSGSTVLILLSPMSWTGSGTLDYTFDLNTHADYRTRTPPGDWSAYDEARSGTFGDVIGMLSANTDYAAFFGPQIGMSGTHNTAFDVTQITLDVVPEPISLIFFGTGLVGVFGFVARRKMQRK